MKFFFFFNHAKKRGTGIIHNKYLLNKQFIKTEKFFFFLILKKTKKSDNKKKFKRINSEWVWKDGSKRRGEKIKIYFFSCRRHHLLSFIE
jgi:hypothetical protein